MQKIQKCVIINVDFGNLLKNTLQKTKEVCFMDKRKDFRKSMAVGLADPMGNMQRKLLYNGARTVGGAAVHYYQLQILVFYLQKILERQTQIGRRIVNDGYYGNSW